MEPKQVNINPAQYKDNECEWCESIYWKQSFIIKKIPGIIAGTGSVPAIMNIPVFICEKCGEILPENKNVLSLNNL